MKISVTVDETGKVISLDKLEDMEKVEFEQEMTDDEYDVFFQNFRHYKVIDGKLVRFDDTEDAVSKERFIARIRKQRKSALMVYDIYDKKCIKGERERDPKIEAWYESWLDLPETYNNNIPYHHQIPKVPKELQKYMK